MEKEHFFRKSNPLLWVLLIQAILVVLAFPQFFVSPNDFMFVTFGDGIKNYFTFQAYLEQSYSIGEFRLMQQGYPYGDYLFFADLTPVLAIPVKAFCLYIYDISSYGVAILNTALISIQFFLVWIVYNILSFFLKTKWLVALMTIGLVWVNPQAFVVNVGHYNLSTPLVFLLGILLWIRIYEYYHEHNKLKIRHLVLMGGLLVLGGFMHLYYLLILGFANTCFVLFWLGYEFFSKKQSFVKTLKLGGSLGVVQLLSLLTCIGLIQGIDGYYDLRVEGNVFYDWPNFKLFYQALYTTPQYHHIKFSTGYTGYMSMPMYLGSFFLYGMVGMLLLRLLPIKQWLNLRTIFGNEKGRFLVFCILTGFICFFVAMGETIQIYDSELIVTNYLNPLYYLHKISSQIEQFRYVARFGWFTFWLWNLGFIFIIDYYWKNTTNKIVKGGLVVLSLLMVVDTIDAVNYLSAKRPKNCFKKEYLEANYLELKTINFSDYQAILPIPYFNEGAEVRGWHLSGTDLEYQAIFGMSLVYDIPIMAINASRLPFPHVQHLFSIFTAQKPDQDLLDKLSDKPILVLHKKISQSEKKYWRMPLEEPARTVTLDGPDIIKKYNMQKVAEGAKFTAYKWDIAKLKN